MVILFTQVKLTVNVTNFHVKYSGRFVPACGGTDDTDDMAQTKSSKFGTSTSFYYYFYAHEIQIV